VFGGAESLSEKILRKLLDDYLRVSNLVELIKRPVVMKLEFSVPLLLLLLWFGGC
jgi:hypothetical protein